MLILKAMIKNKIITMRHVLIFFLLSPFYINAQVGLEYFLGDLSEYNILNIREKPCIIDVGQAVPKEHPLHDELHNRDMNNMHKYWKKHIRGLKLEDLK